MGLMMGITIMNLSFLDPMLDAFPFLHLVFCLCHNQILAYNNVNWNSDFTMACKIIG
jgi:hypothetical protein